MWQLQLNAIRDLRSTVVRPEEQHVDSVVPQSSHLCLSQSRIAFTLQLSFYRNTIHSAPMVAASSTESPISSRRSGLLTPTTSDGATVCSVRSATRSGGGGGFSTLTTISIALHSRKRSAAKWRKLMLANQYHSDPDVNFAFVSSRIRRARPSTKPVHSAARAPLPVRRGLRIPRRKHAAIGGAMYACTLC